MFRINTLLITTASLFLACNGYSYELDQFDPLIEKALSDYNIPGVAVGVVVDGEVVYAKGFGLRNVESQLPVTPDTMFALGSLTKSFTAFSLGMLVEQGLVNWDQPVVDVLSGFRLYDQYATQNLTFRDLLSHRSGMARHPFFFYNNPASREELFKKMKYLEPAWDIRDRFNYGDLMYMSIGLAVQELTGKVWEDFVAENILSPLGMKNTNFCVADTQKMDDFSYPYLERKDVLKKMPFREFRNIAPAAGMNSSANDLSKWMQMLLANGAFKGKQLISTGSLQEMFAAQVIASGYAENKECLMNAYGLGWMIHPYRGHYSVSHDGGLDGFTSVLSIFPNDGVGIVVLANKNLTSFPRYLTLEIFDKIMGLPDKDWINTGYEFLKNTTKSMQENQVSEDVLRKKETRPSHPIADYAGDYEHPGYGTYHIEVKDGSLVATLHGITSLLDHWHYDVFAIEKDTQDLLIQREGMKFTFRTNLNGDIEELHVPLEQKTKEIVFKKKAEMHTDDLEFFKPFIGNYEIYGITVEVALRDGTLIVIVPGQPIFELEPVGENEFNVRNNNYSVRFMRGDDGLAHEALLVLPFGAYCAARI